MRRLTDTGTWDVREVENYPENGNETPLITTETSASELTPDPDQGNYN
jgi:hypothetical protein